MLAALMHAAALGDLSMRDVLEWVSRPDSGRDQILSLLRRSPEPGFVDEVGQFIATNDRTRTSITSTIMPALGWLTSPAASAAATGGHPFDVAELLESRATVYLLGAEETHTGPLVCALTGYIAREARRIAACQPSGRLDPPLTLALDEAGLVSPVPLDRWSADMGGRGVCIIAAFQSRSQLIDTYGPARAATTINNAGSKVVFGGTGDRDDLNYWSTLAGERDEPITTTDLHGRVASRSVRKVPVLAPAQLAQLPAHKVVVFAPGMPPVIGQAEKAWKRGDVRAVIAPNSWRVRVAVLAGHAAAAVGGWVMRPLRATGQLATRTCRRAAHAITAWTMARRSEIVRLIARARAQVEAWREATTDTDTDTVATEPVAAEPAGAEPAGAQVIRFPGAEWPPSGVDASPAALPGGDWPHDNGHPGGDRGRWN